MTEFRTLREALGWSPAEARDILEYSSLSYVYALDRGTKQAHPHTLALMRLWAAPWFPVERRPRPGRKEAA